MVGGRRTRAARGLATPFGARSASEFIAADGGMPGSGCCRSRSVVGTGYRARSTHPTQEPHQAKPTAPLGIGSRMSDGPTAVIWKSSSATIRITNCVQEQSLVCEAEPRSTGPTSVDTPRQAPLASAHVRGH